MLSAVSAETEEAVAFMQESGDQAQSTVTVVLEAKELLDMINVEMEKTVNMISEISNSTAEQQKAMNHLSDNIYKVSDMADHNLDIVSHTEAMAQKLDAVVARMSLVIQSYRIK